MTTGKYLKYIVFILLVVVTLVLFTHGLKTEKVVMVAATIEEVAVEGGEVPQITDINVSTDRVNLLRYPKDVPPNFPGVWVLVVYSGNRINYWTSVPYTGSGTYEITTGLGSVPPDGSEVYIVVNVDNDSGVRIARNTTNAII